MVYCKKCNKEWASSQCWQCDIVADEHFTDGYFKPVVIKVQPMKMKAVPKSEVLLEVEPMKMKVGVNGQVENIGMGDESIDEVLSKAFSIFFSAGGNISDTEEQKRSCSLNNLATYATGSSPSLKDEPSLYFNQIHGDIPPLQVHKDMHQKSSFNKAQGRRGFFNKPLRGGMFSSVEATSYGMYSP